MRYPILPVGAFIAAFLVLIPAFWLSRTRNIPTLSLIVWLFTLNVIYGANSLVWSGNVWDKAPVWCDISAKLVIGASTALPACTLCICRCLAMIGGNKTVGLNHGDRRRVAIFDLGLCWGIPIIFMALHYLVQDHRYNIVQYIGCQPATYVSIPVIFIVWLPPLLLSLGTFVYAGIALYRFLQMRLIFSSVLQVSNSPMSTSQYIRLIAMSTTLMLWSTVLTSVTISANASRGLRPWISWGNVHSEWSQVDAYVWMLMSPRSRSLALLSWWTIPVSSVIFFIFLGFGEDALNEYRRAGNAIITMFPSRTLPERDEKFMKEISLALPFSDSSSYKNLSPYFPGSSHASAPAMKTSKLRELILPLPVLAGARTASTVSGSDSLNSLKPLRPPMRSGTTNSAFYFHPNTLRSMSSHSEMTRFSISDDHLAFGQMYGPPTPLSINAPAMNQQAAFQGLPPIQPLRSLNSMVGFSHSKTQSQSSVKSNGRRWSVRSEKLRPAPLRLSPAEGRLRECASGMRTVTVAEPREALMRGSVQVTVQRQQFYD